MPYDFRPFDLGAAQQRGAANAMAQMQTMGMADKLNRANTMRQLSQESTATGKDLADMARQAGYPEIANKLQAQRIKKSTAILGFLKAKAPMVRDQAGLDAFNTEARSMGSPAGSMPTQWNPDTQRYLANLAGKAKKQIIKLAPGGRAFDITGKEIARGGRKTENIITVLYPGGRKQAFRKDDPNLDRALKAGATPFDQKVQASDIAGLQKKTISGLEGKVLTSTEGIARLKRIEKQFDAKYLKFDTSIKAAYIGFAEKAGFNVSKQDKKLLSDYSGFKRTAIENINLGIKELTGAQMSEKEADRIRLGMPDPGEGIFGGDSPTQFKSKMRDTIKALEAIRRRAQYFRKNGIAFTPENYDSNPLENFSKGKAKTSGTTTAPSNYVIRNGQLVPK